MSTIAHHPQGSEPGSGPVPETRLDLDSRHTLVLCRPEAIAEAEGEFAAAGGRGRLAAAPGAVLLLFRRAGDGDSVADSGPRQLRLALGTGTVLLGVARAAGWAETTAAAVAQLEAVAAAREIGSAVPEVTFELEGRTCSVALPAGWGEQLATLVERAGH